MAQLKDLLVNGSARVIGSLFANLSGNVLNFGVCSTAAATAAKTVTTNGTFELITGSKILVLFSETDSSNAPTLNVNGTGAKNIKINASDGIGKGFLAAQQYYWFVYDGTNWRTAGAGITQIIPTQYGGTGNSSFTANRMIYSNTATKLASGSITTNGSYLSNISYLSVNREHQTNYNLYVNGTSCHSDIATFAKKIHLTGTGVDTALIDFSRSGAGAPNYINVPTNGSLAFSVGGAAGVNIKLTIQANDVYPWTTKQINLGTSSNLWNSFHVYRDLNIYGNESTGDESHIKFNASDGTQRAIIAFNGNTDNTVNSTTHLKIATSYGDIRLNAASNNISIGDGGNALLYRTQANVRAGLYYHTSGRESVVFANKYSQASWIFVNNIDPAEKKAWNNLGTTPAVQIHHNALYINRAVRDADTADYNFFVNGTSRFDGNLTLYSASGDSPGLIFHRGGTSLTDWRIYVTGGQLSFASATDASTWTRRAYFLDGSGTFVPNTTNTYDLGSSSLKWKNIYATTLNGNLAKKLTIQANGIQKGQFNNSADVTVNLGNVAQDLTGANSGNAANINADTFAGMTRQQWLNTVYPIGSIYMSVSATSPATLFGGTWESLGGRFLIGQDGTYTAGSTGGEASHTLTLAEAPAHTHSRGTMNITGGYKTGWGDASGGGIISNTWSGAMYGSRNGTAFYYSNPTSSTNDGHKNYINFDASRSWTGETDSKGGGGAHNNMPPYLAVYMWKRTA